MGETQPQVMAAEEVEGFLNHHIRPFRQWYLNDARKHRAYLSRVRQSSVGFGLLATVLAAFPPSLAEKLFGNPTGSETIRWLVVACSAIATLTSGTLQSYYAQLARRREAGRVKVSYLEQLVGITLYSKPMSLTDRLEYMQQVVRDCAEIEMEYGAPGGALGNEHAASAADAGLPVFGSETQRHASRTSGQKS